jgi:hypothetical protein
MGCYRHVWMDGYECDVVMNEKLNSKLNLSYKIQCMHT